MQLAQKLARLPAPVPLANAVRGLPLSSPFLDALVEERRPFGALWKWVRAYIDGHRHGEAPLHAGRDADSSIVAQVALDPTLAEVDFGRLLLLDTETTGLAGGTGTLPFLIGVGSFQASGALCVEQLFLRRPGEERPMLAELAERLSEASCVVTYNGKSFDWPLLRSRFVMNRLAVPKLPPHLDLLHCARRIFRRRLRRVSLIDVETDVLGHVRKDDVPGAMVPELYFSFLRGSDGESLRGVFEHNACDLLALAALLGDLVRRLHRPQAQDDARDVLGCAEIALRAKDPARAEALALLAARGDPRWAGSAWRLAARAQWKQTRRADAVESLLRALDGASAQESPGIRLALAKHFEHGLRDFSAALVHARLASGGEPPTALLRRIQRLEGKAS